jgi:hypothetical protein
MSALMLAAAFLSPGAGGCGRGAAAKRVEFAPTRGHGACWNPVE